ncbi:hypothetical protein BDV95DRAFT_344770 [Massariosphaeria phaeospora]|uniref:Uncharacterized protein n=1 Tax=Massariosphaeria phaeospora TaxID=100035 RepID=A0A7C8IC71_9PLEO|nr:hypothetical protein BDV95DRAFT_344770 [Massariosphaeria phaeospora]
MSGSVRVWRKWSFSRDGQGRPSRVGRGLAAKSQTGCEIATRLRDGEIARLSAVCGDSGSSSRVDGWPMTGSWVAGRISSHRWPPRVQGQGCGGHLPFNIARPRLSSVQRRDREQRGCGPAEGTGRRQETGDRIRQPRVPGEAPEACGVRRGEERARSGARSGRGRATPANGEAGHNGRGSCGAPA